MLNTSFIKSMVLSRLSNNKELSEEEFCDLFGGLEELELEEVLKLLEKLGISVVEEKKDDMELAKALHNLNDGMAASKLTVLTNEQLCVLYQRGERAAMDALVMKNKRLVYKLAKKVHRDYNPESLEVDDLCNEGCLGLMIAADRFEVEKGFRFSTYACWWIHQSITRATINNGYTMRLPVHMFEQVVAVKRCRNRRNPGNIFELQSFLAEEGRDYTIEQLDNLLLLGDKYLNTASLNELVGQGDSKNTERGEFIPSEMSVEDDIMGKMLAIDINRALETLTARERTVIAMRYGLGNVVPMTLDQLGQEFNVTRERIRQIENKAMRKLSRAKYLREYICA